MKCPYCGTELEEKMTYCPDCGGRLKQEDNSKDDTLRLPDLSGVPLSGETQRVRRSSPPPKKKSKAAMITAAVCVMIAAAAAAICVAIALSGRNAKLSVPDALPDETEESYRYGEPDYGRDERSPEIPDGGGSKTEEEPNPALEEKPAENNNEEDKEDEEENEENEIFAEDVTPEPEPATPDEPEETEGADEAVPEDGGNQSVSVSTSE